MRNTLPKFFIFSSVPLAFITTLTVYSPLSSLLTSAIIIIITFLTCAAYSVIAFLNLLPQLHFEAYIE